MRLADGPKEFAVTLEVCKARIVKRGLASYEDAVMLANSLESDANDFVERY